MDVCGDVSIFLDDKFGDHFVGPSSVFGRKNSHHLNVIEMFESQLLEVEHRDVEWKSEGVCPIKPPWVSMKFSVPSRLRIPGMVRKPGVELGEPETLWC